MDTSQPCSIGRGAVGAGSQLVPERVGILLVVGSALRALTSLLSALRIVEVVWIHVL